MYNKKEISRNNPSPRSKRKWVEFFSSDIKMVLIIYLFRKKLCEKTSLL